MNWPSSSVVNAGIRYGATAAGSAITALAIIGLINQGDATGLGAAVSQIGTGLVSVVTGVSAIVTIVAPIFGMLSQTMKSKIQAVNAEDNGVKVVAASTPAPTVSAPLK